MASFQAKIGWNRQRKRENKKLSFLFVPARRVIKNSKKIAKNFKKLKKYNYGFISSQNRMETTEKERKQKLTFNFVPAQREIENSKKIAKKLKKLKNTIMSSFQAKIGWKRQRKIENKKCRSVSFLLDA